MRAAPDARPLVTHEPDARPLVTHEPKDYKSWAQSSPGSVRSVVASSH